MIKLYNQNIAFNKKFNVIINTCWNPYDKIIVSYLLTGDFDYPGDKLTVKEIKVDNAHIDEFWSIKSELNNLKFSRIIISVLWSCDLEKIKNIDEDSIILYNRTKTLYTLDFLSDTSKRIITALYHIFNSSGQILIFTDINYNIHDNLVNHLFNCFRIIDRGDNYIFIPIQRMDLYPKIDKELTGCLIEEIDGKVIYNYIEYL
jgi:hypothetical protein